LVTNSQMRAPHGSVASATFLRLLQSLAQPDPPPETAVQSARFLLRPGATSHVPRRQRAAREGTGRQPGRERKRWNAAQTTSWTSAASRSSAMSHSPRGSP